MRSRVVKVRDVRKRLGFDRRHPGVALAQPSAAETPASPVELDAGLFLGPELDRLGIEGLARSGFRSIVNLADEGEPGQILSPNVEATWAHTFALEHARLSAGPFPDREYVARLVQLLGRLPGPIYLHATDDGKGGLLALAALALRRGWSADEALGEARSRGMNLRTGSAERFLREVLGSPGTVRPQPAPELVGLA